MITASGIEARARGFISMLLTYKDATAAIKDGDIRAKNRELIDNLETALTAMAEKEDTIVLDRKLSPMGQAEKLAQLAKETLAGSAMKALAQRTDNLDAASTSLTAKLFPVPSAPVGQDAVVTYLREQEIRSGIRPMSLGEQVSLYADAVQTQKTEVLRAFRLTPLPLAIDAETMDKLDRQYVEVNQPDQVARLTALDEARAQIRSLAAALQVWLAATPDPSAILNAKMTPPIQQRNDLGGPNRQQPPPRTAADRAPEHQPRFT